MQTLRSKRLKWIVVILFLCMMFFFFNAKDQIMKEEVPQPQSLFDTKTSGTNKQEEKMQRDDPVWLWIDIPNDFPWRNCLQEYTGFLTLLHCEESLTSQQFIMEPQAATAMEKGILPKGKLFKWKTSERRYVIPGTTLQGNVSKETLVLNDTSEEGFWIWTTNGQLRWSQGCRKCVTSIKSNKPVEMKFCNDQHSEDQNVEIGFFEPEDSQKVLRPLDVKSWRERQNNARNRFLEENIKDVKKALAEIDEDDIMNRGGFKGGKRRAAVFYVDRGKGAITNVRWWIYTWKFVGLNAAEEGFDLILMVHPEAIENLPEECKEVSEKFEPSYGKEGECLYKPYLGVAYRDKTYDAYMNSQECLFGPGAEFLKEYQMLLRVDLDTFPTPSLLGYWPEGVVADKGYGTMMGLDSIKNALKELACSVGIEHQGWFNIGSSWYGDGRRVRNLSKLTVALNKYGRAYLFGPGTHCRCATCASLPKDCEWGSGPYAGVLLLYLQEIAINKILTPKEWKNLTVGLIDKGVTDSKQSVCRPLLLHCLHNAELFSKLAFGIGKYTDMDMSELDITNVRDYATFMALTSNSQGKNGDVALQKFNEKLGNSSWNSYCKGQQ